MKCLKLLEVIYAKNVACEVQKIRNERCCGCKVYEQDCLMMDEHETWQMHGLNAIEQVNNTSSTWNEFMAAIKILNVENHMILVSATIPVRTGFRIYCIN
jgi:hypothetical protein